MIPRILEKDVRLALLKLEKFPFDQIRKLAKDVADGSKSGGTDDAHCEKCEKIVAKIFAMEKVRPMAFTTSGKTDEERLLQKLETIDERPLVEAEPRVESFDDPPKPSHGALRPYDVAIPNRRNLKDVAFDEIASKLMSSPVREIDRRLLNTYMNPHSIHRTTLTIEHDAAPTKTKGVEREFIAPNIAETRAFEREEEEIAVDGFRDVNTPPHCREYALNLVGESLERTWKAERCQPLHCVAAYPTYIEKGTERCRMLQQLEELGTSFMGPQQLMLVPLPPNETAISSRDSSVPEAKPKEEDGEKANVTAISYQTLPRSIGRGNRKEGKKGDDLVTFFSTVSDNSPINAAQTRAFQKDTIDDVPLSVLLRRVRQRSTIEQEMYKKSARYLSKGPCLPPLDLRPRSKTCPPRPCPAKRSTSTPKKMPCPPPKKNVCPPPKKTTCPPPKKTQCPPRRDSDPCKPPPPCPSRKKPCGLFTGNRIKETISLILCSGSPIFGKSLLNNATVLRLPNRGAVQATLSAHAAYPALWAGTTASRLRSWGVLSSRLRIASAEAEGVALVRDFKPWSPIPSWPMPKKKTEKRLVCPKDGCQPPKPSHGPCKEAPCSANPAGSQRKYANTDCDPQEQILI
ncbi:unnamed protein product, partial [Iphiclides podalirius]